VPVYGWVLLSWAFYQAISLFGVIVYGELEFWLALWKISCVMVTYLLAILVNTGGIGHDYIGFRYWKDPGPFANGINGFGQSFVLAAVYHCGTEMVAITGGESRNPSRDLPKVRIGLLGGRKKRNVAKRWANDASKTNRQSGPPCSESSSSTWESCSSPASR